MLLMWLYWMRKLSVGDHGDLYVVPEIHRIPRQRREIGRRVFAAIIESAGNFVVVVVVVIDAGGGKHSTQVIVVVVVDEAPPLDHSLTAAQLNAQRIYAFDQ